jgi:hypothetical protein
MGYKKEEIHEKRRRNNLNKDMGSIINLAQRLVYSLLRFMPSMYQKATA